MVIEANEVPDYMTGSHCVHVEHRYASAWCENLAGEGYNVAEAV